MGLIKDNLYKDVVAESSEEVASIFFNYLYNQYGYQPEESLETCPELYDELGDLLDKEIYDKQVLYNLIDKYFLEIVNYQRKRGILSVLGNTLEEGENIK